MASRMKWTMLGGLVFGVGLLACSKADTAPGSGAATTTGTGTGGSTSGGTGGGPDPGVPVVPGTPDTSVVTALPPVPRMVNVVANAVGDGVNISFDPIDG